KAKPPRRQWLADIGACRCCRYLLSALFSLRPHAGSCACICCRGKTAIRPDRREPPSISGGCRACLPALIAVLIVILIAGLIRRGLCAVITGRLITGFGGRTIRRG